MTVSSFMGSSDIKQTNKQRVDTERRKETFIFLVFWPISSFLQHWHAPDSPEIHLFKIQISGQQTLAF